MMKAKDIVPGSVVRYGGIEATLLRAPGRGDLLLAWENQFAGFGWPRYPGALDIDGLDPKWKYLWWITADTDVELLAAAPKPKTIAQKTMKLSEVKAGSRITISLQATSYPCSPYDLHNATSKITGTLFKGEGGSPIIAWKAEEKTPLHAWNIPARPEMVSYHIPADFKRAYYLGYPDLEVEVEDAKRVKPADHHFGFLLSCIGAGALMTSLAKATTSPTVSSKQIPERITQ